MCFALYLRKSACAATITGNLHMIDKDEIIVYVFLLDATQFPTTDASFKECCYDCRKEIEVIPITADSFGSEFANLDFDKVFSGSGADFYGIFLLLYVEIKGDVYITTKLMYVVTRF